MSKNNSIKKSDKKFIRREKARIRAAVLDFKKQEEMIDALYKKFKETKATNKTNEIITPKEDEKISNSQHQISNKVPNVKKNKTKKQKLKSKK